MKNRLFTGGKWLVRGMAWLAAVAFCLSGVSRAAGEGQQFEEPTVRVFDYYESDEPVEISSTWPEGADSLAIYIQDEQGRDALPGCMWNQKNKGWTYYSFEVNVQDRLLEPGSYIVVVELKGKGYRTSRYKWPFLILPAGMTVADYEAQQGNPAAAAAGRAEATATAEDASGKEEKTSGEVTQKTGKAEGQITFQGIPWRSSLGEVERLLTESGFIKEGAVRPTSVYTPFNLVPGRYMQKDEGRLVIIPQTMDHHGYIRNCQVLMLWSSDVEKTIGGYEADSVYFTFAYDGENTELTTVELVLKTDDEERAIRDLQQKLTGIYGKHQRGSYKNLYTLVWKGAEDTAVMILSDSKYGEAVSLYYGMVSPSAIYDAADKRLTSRPGQADPGDTGGL